MRHMDTAYRIDIMAHRDYVVAAAGSSYGLYLRHTAAGRGALTAMWIVYVLWFALTWAAFANRNKPVGAKLYLIEDWTRYLLIPTLIITAITSLMGYGPFSADIGERWYSAKVLTFGLALIIGVILRLVMNEWQDKFKILAAGPDAAVEAKLAKSISIGRGVAYIY